MSDPGMTPYVTFGHFRTARAAPIIAELAEA